MATKIPNSVFDLVVIFRESKKTSHNFMLKSKETLKSLGPSSKKSDRWGNGLLIIVVKRFCIVASFVLASVSSQRTAKDNGLFIVPKSFQ